MAELLIKAIDHIHPDPETDRRGAYKKGDIVLVMPDGHSWGNKEGPPLFVRVAVPGVTIEQIEAYTHSWKLAINIEVLSANASTGVYSVRISCSNPGISGTANITREQVENYLSSWGATIDAVGTNSVEFTVNLWNTMRSDGFWRADVSLIGFSLIGYANPIATVDVNISGVLAKWTPQRIAQVIEERGGTVISYNEPIGRFSISRHVVIAAFQADLKEKLEQVFIRRQYYFEPEDVDTALSIGGILELTAQQVLAHVKSKLDL